MFTRSDVGTKIAKMRCCRAFIYSAGLVLVATGIAKLISSGATTRILEMPDPILGISYKHVFLIVGSIELWIAAVCFFSNKIELQARLVVWLGTIFTLYRYGIFWVGYHRPCSCLGTLTDSLGIPPDKADLALKCVLAYLLVGGLVVLFVIRTRSKRSQLPRKGPGVHSASASI
jgi:hypothetical protein